MKFLNKPLLLRVALVSALLLAFASPLRAHRIARTNGVPTTGWANGDIVMNLHFGTFSGGAITIDGYSSYDTPAEGALAIWNQVLARSTFKVVHNATFAPTLGDGKNSIYFATTTPNGPFPADAAAMTFVRLNGTRIVEADVILNLAKIWNSYRGALRTSTGGQPLYDIRRIALREFGRVLGLDYPDQDTPPQVVTAQMNSTPSALDTLAQDDVNGVQALYGVPETNARFGNLSTRGFVGTGDGVLIGGLIVEGPSPKKFYVRVLGPSLATFGVAGALGDPLIELRDQGGKVIASNDNWKDAREAEIRTTGSPPLDDRDCGLIVSLPPGGYTAIVTGKGGATGVAIIEVYDYSPDGSVRLANISTRGFVGSGDNVLIGGIVISGPASQRTLVRVLGPSLAGFGVAGSLTDPTVELRDQAGNLIATNDNWKDTQEAEIRQAGTLPIDDRDCGLLVTLEPGNYTVIVRGKNGGTGVGIFEAFRLGRTVLSPQMRSFIPPTIFVTPGSRTLFDVAVINTQNQAVTWATTAGTIAANGTFTPPVIPPAGPITVTVRSVADPGIFQVFQVTVLNEGTANSSSTLRLLPNQGTLGISDSCTGNSTVAGFTLMADGGSPLSHYTWYPTVGEVQPLGVTVEPLTGLFKSSGARNPITNGFYHVTVSDGARTARGVVAFRIEQINTGPPNSAPFPATFFSQLNLANFALVNARANRAYGATLYVETGSRGAAAVLPLTWTLASGSGPLPEGLVLDQSSGVVRGNVLNSAAGKTYSFRIQVRDSTGRVANAAGGGPLYTIRVDP